MSSFPDPAEFQGENTSIDERYLYGTDDAVMQVYEVEGVTIRNPRPRSTKKEQRILDSGQTVTREQYYGEDE